MLVCWFALLSFVPLCLRLSCYELSTHTFPDLFIASWNKDFVTIVWHWIFWQPIFELIPRKVLLPNVVYNSCHMWRCISALLFVLCQSLVEILPARSILSGEFLLLSSLATLVSRWSWSGMMILYSGISLSEVSTYLGISPGNTKVFLYNTRGISAGVSTSLSSYSFSWKFFTKGTWYAVSLFEYI